MDIQSTLQSMTIEEKVGQMFMLAFAADQLDAARILMVEHLVGAAYIADENVPKARAAVHLTNTLQSYARSTRLGIPLLLGADQEGTWSVMTAESAMGPGNMALGATGDPQYAYDMYSVIAKEMSSVGLNTVLGPACDCNSNPFNSIIEMRSFGEDPGLVAAMTGAAVRGLQDNGAVATLKHFPGHGDTRVDSHRGLPTVNRTRDELFRVDLRPFAEGIKAGAKMVMTAHIIFTALDKEQPATLSPAILGNVLRGELGFDGVVVSDSMNMGSMKRNYDPAEAAIQAFNAGVDLMMLAEEHYDHDVETYLQNQRSLIGAVIQAAEAGTISSDRINDAVGRILRLKRDAGFSIAPVPEGSTIVGQDSHRAVELEAARAAVAILRDRNQLLPIQAATPVTLVNTTLRSAYDVLTATRGIGPNQAKPAFDIFADAMRARCDDVAIIAVEDYVKSALPAEGLIMAVSENYTLPGMDFDTALQAQIVSELHAYARDRLLAVALRDPYQLAQYPEIDAFVCSFSFRPCAAVATAQLLLGEIEPRGRTPVSVPGTELEA